MTDPLTLERPIAGRYRVLRELGRGGMGAVYLVEHVHTGDQLALKVLLQGVASVPDAVKRFQGEARTSALIKSENVVKITDADVAPELAGAPFLVMELLNGKDFEKLIAERGPLPAEQVVGYLRQAARAIDRAHELGVTHRDLKPENLFLHAREDGAAIVKVLDFGISKVVDPNGTSSKMTQTGVIIGTPLFMSPEQAQGKDTIGPKTDLWALGLIAVYLLTGQHFWKSATIFEIVLDIVARPMPRLSQRFPTHSSPALDDWFARACHRVAERRFATAHEQVAALARCLRLEDKSLPTSAPPFSTAALPGATLKSAPVGNTATTGDPVSMSLSGSRGARADARSSVARWMVAIAAGVGLMGGGLALGHWRTHPLPLVQSVSGVAPSLIPEHEAQLNRALPSGASNEVSGPPSSPLAPPPASTVTPMASASPLTHPIPIPTPSSKPPLPVGTTVHHAAVCDPPFMFDDQGRRHFKPECFTSSGSKP